jgi:hypothetical protein
VCGVVIDISDVPPKHRKFVPEYTAPEESIFLSNGSEYLKTYLITPDTRIAFERKEYV